MKRMRVERGRVNYKREREEKREGKKSAGDEMRKDKPLAFFCYSA